MTAPLPWPSPPAGRPADPGPVPLSADWLRLARLAPMLGS
jgi:hypothetical protein